MSTVQPTEARIALVTGGSGGIGAACARSLASAGASVFVAGRDAGRREGVAAAIRAEGQTAWPLELDVTDPDSIAGAVESVRAQAGRLDWLVNNAGIAISAPLVARPGEEDLYRRHMEVNFHGPRALIEAFLPAMRERGDGRVVNVASSAGLFGYPYVAAYCASKHALVGYTRAASKELAKAGVTMNAICPHYVDSPMLAASVQRVMEKTGRSEEEARAFFCAENPGGNLVSVEEVAACCLELCTGDHNGAIVELDGSGFRGVTA